jgi:hypothetical protein
VFHTSFRALQALNTSVADSVREALEVRYSERKNVNLLSAVKFLSDPARYCPGGEFLEMPQLRVVIRELCERLFPEDSESNSSLPASAGIIEDEVLEDLSYEQRLAKQFQDDLNQGVTSVTSSGLQHTEEEMVLAAKTGELTNKLGKLLNALLSVPASSIESERAFSVASRYVTKIRSRLSDQTLDNFSFAKCRFQNDKLKLVNIQILSFIRSTSVVKLISQITVQYQNFDFFTFTLFNN